MSEFLHRYTFPLRDGVDAVVSVPCDLTKDEAQRLSTYVMALAVLHPPESPTVVKFLPGPTDE